MDFREFGYENMKISPPEYFFSGPWLMLAQAIARHDLAEAKELIPRTDLNRAGAQGMTLLFFTLQHAAGEKPVPLQIITLLVKAGADPFQDVPGARYPLSIALQARSSLYAQAFLDAGVNPNVVNDSTPIIFESASEYAFETLKLLIARGADVNKRDALGNTVLNEALAGYQLDLVEWLLDHGADPHTVNAHGLSFAKQLQTRIERQQESSLAQRKMVRIGSRIIQMGVKWPPDSREMERERMRAARRLRFRPT